MKNWATSASESFPYFRPFLVRLFCQMPLRLVCTCSDATVRLLSPGSGECITTMLLPSMNVIADVAYAAAESTWKKKTHGKKVENGPLYRCHAFSFKQKIYIFKGSFRRIYWNESMVPKVAMFFLANKCLPSGERFPGEYIFLLNWRGPMFVGVCKLRHIF